MTDISSVAPPADTADRELLKSVLQSMSQKIAGGAGGVDVPDMRTQEPAAPDAPAAAPVAAAQPAAAGRPAVASGPMTITAGGDVGALMRAMTSGVESHGSLSADNPRTHAHGPWQIMPANYEPWAKAAGVDPADHSFDAQQKIVAHIMGGYLDAFGSIDAVAVAWYAGPSAAKAWLKNPNAARFNKKQGAGDEPSINEYVQRIRNAMGA